MEVSEISEKSRSLDLQSLYDEKTRVSGEKSRTENCREEIRSLKRKRRSSSPVKKRRKGRKEVSLRTFATVVSDSKKGSNAAGHRGSNSVPLKLSGFVLYGKNPAKKKNGTVLGDGNLKNSSSLNNVSHGLGDNVIVIPKRRRGFFGQKKFQNDHVGKQAVSSRDIRATSLGTASSSKTSSEVQRSNLNGDSIAPAPSSTGKRKKITDEFKENNSIRANSDLWVNGENGSRNLAPKVRRNRRKRQKPAVEMQAHDIELPVVANVVKVFEDMKEDDEENLEQNAARMLSSRFDPSCTGFSRNGAGSKSQSADGSLYPPSFHREFKSSGTRASAESESASVDAAGRVLRPRKQHRHRGLFRRRRRHFYEICSTDLDAYWVVNQRIKVFWPLDMSWYFGVVKDYDPVTKLHHVKYDDRDEEWINLQNERFKLLLLPGEVPCRFNSNKSGMTGKQVDEGEDVNGLDDSCTGNFMDSEPIISWLARSTRRVKSSPLGMGKKQKRSHAGKNVLHPTLSDNSVKTPNRCLATPLSRTDTDELSIGSVMLVRSLDGEIVDKSIVNSSACGNNRKLPLVYFRRRFRKVQPGLGNTSEESSAAGSVSLLASVADRVGALEEFDIALQSSRMKDSKHLDQESLLLFGETFSLSKLTVSPLELEVKLRLSLPLLRVLDLVFGAENFWLHNTLLLLRYGTVMAAWPRVHLEVLFIDNTVGLRHLLFEGCLSQAVTFMCFILGVFQQPNACGKHGDQQVPVTSIRFQLSGFQGLGRRLVFVFYSFLELRSSKWLYLDNKLRRYCIVTKELPLAECTYANIMILQSGIDQTPSTSAIEEPVFFKGSQKRTRQGVKHRDYSSCKYDEKRGRLPPFVLSFAAAPTFFLSLHLNLLMKNNVASISFQNRNPMSLRGHPEKYDTVTGGACSLVDDSANQDSEMLDHMEHSLSQDAAASRWLSCAHSEVETDALSMNRDGDWIKTSQNNTLSVTGTATGFQDSRKNESFETVSQLDQCLCNAGSCGCATISWSSAPEDLSAQDKSETRCLPCLNSASVQSPELGQTDCQSFDKGALSTQLCVADLAWSMNDCTIRSPNPTAPRSIWHRNRRSSFSSSFSYHSKMWPDGRADFVRNGCVNGSRKPRTQVSYLLPFGGYNFGSKPRSHHRKGRPYQRIKNDSVKRISDGLRSPQIYPEMLSCDANVLVTTDDRGWRECGAQVVLESPDHKDWRLLVKISGITRYSHKAHQFLQPGTTNRYTHAMMWKGGKDWILEFSDRNQWSLFKGMHEECYNRNIRAASVKNIPIPGVRLIEDSDDNAVEVPFVRNSPKYFRLVGTEVDMAMDPSRVLYDMESDDEEWISKLRNSDANGTQVPEISEEMFERAMDMFEKVSYAHQCDDFSNDEIECFMDGVGPVDVIKAIHEHWRQKRKRKGMPLIRQLQPPLWERYQQQLKDRELAMSRTHNYSNGCKEKAVLAQKPPMFAFCLRPRGLEVPNKGTKQRSHRKFTAIGQYGAFSRDQDGLQVSGRKLNGFAAIGDEKALVAVQNHESLEVSPRLQLSSRSSPRDAAVPGILSMSSDRSERSQYPKLQRNKSKKMGMHLAPTDPQMVLASYNQRTMVKKNGVNRWNMGMPEWPTLRQYQPDGFQRQRVDQFGGSEFDEFRLRDASSAAQHASNMAKLKREKAQRLMHKADVALHKAVAALTIAEAMRTSEEDLIGDG